MTAMPRAAEAAHYYPDVASAEHRSHAVAPETAFARVIRVTAEADPNILARIVQPMVKLDILPQRLNMLSEGDGTMVAEITLDGVAESAGRLENTLRAVIGVVAVACFTRPVPARESAAGPLDDPA
ncbi:MAG: hypothetical protein ACLFU3_03300 [Dichotomicrobium sp.]